MCKIKTLCVKILLSEFEKMLQKEKIIIIKRILCCVFCISIAAFGAWWYLSPKPVIKSNVGNISQGTFSYIRFVYYADQSNLKIFQDFQESMAIGYLADGLGFTHDPYYSKFLAMEQRTRIQRAAIQWIKHKQNVAHIDIEMAFKRYGIESDPEQATKSIQSCIQQEKHGFRLKCQDVEIGQMNKKPLRLSMLKPLLTPEEWYQFLSFLPAPMEDAYKSYLIRYLYYIVHQNIINFYNPVLEELEQIDHNQVAKRYISVKYGMAHEGIYPTRRLNLDFPQTMLFNHFFAIQHRFLPVQSVQVQYSVFETMDLAEMVYKKLRNGESLIDLAKQYAMNAHFIQTAYPHKISGYGVNGMPSTPQQRAIIDNFLLDAATKNILLPTPHQLDRGVLVAQLSDLKRQTRQLKYRDYQFAVKRDLSLKTLKKKYRIDVEDAIKEIQWQRVIHENQP